MTRDDVRKTAAEDNRQLRTTWRAAGEPVAATIPPPEVAPNARRISIVFFHQPNYDALIECIPTCTEINNPPKYRPVLSGNYRDQKYSDTLISGATK